MTIGDGVKVTRKSLPREKVRPPVVSQRVWGGGGVRCWEYRCSNRTWLQHEVAKKYCNALNVPELSETHNNYLDIFK